MADEILDEIWRVRAELVKKHGGIEGYWKYVQKLDRAHRRRQAKQTTGRKRKTKTVR